MKLFVAIPAYSRSLTCETARSLLSEQGAAFVSGVELQVAFIPGTSLITQARNQAVAEFLASDADRMVFVDADVAWEPGALLKIGAAQRDFVGGAYRFKTFVEDYPVHWIAERGELWADPDTGFLEVAALPGGFLSLSRDVFSRLAAAFPERTYEHGGRIFHAFFHCPPGQGEDGAFCADWRAIGGEVWLDPTPTLTHVDGAHSYTGCIGDWLRSRIPLPTEEIA